MYKNGQKTKFVKHGETLACTKCGETVFLVSFNGPTGKLKGSKIKLKCSQCNVHRYENLENLEKVLGVI